MHGRSLAQGPQSFLDHPSPSSSSSSHSSTAPFHGAPSRPTVRPSISSYFSSSSLLKSQSSLLLLAFVLATRPASVAASIWDVDIDYGPAPPPDEGPPGSRNASRDKSLLPGQICGIVGAYAIVVCFFLTLVFTIGRRRRLEALRANGFTVEVEMQKPVPKPLNGDASAMTKDGATVTASELKSPTSPGSNKSWLPSPLRFKFKKGAGSSAASSVRNVSAPNSPGAHTTASFDTSNIDEHRQREMERLYAAVMEHDAKQARVVADNTTTTTEDADGVHPAPRLNTDLARVAASGAPQSPRSPMRPIYPPDHQLAQQQQQQQQQRHASTGTSSPPGSPVVVAAAHHPSATSLRSEPNSVGSGATTAGASTKRRGPLRNLRLSSTARRYASGARGNAATDDDDADNDDDMRTPLSPQSFNTAASADRRRRGGGGGGDLPTPSTAATGGADSDGYYEGLDEPAPLPSAAPQRGVGSAGASANGSQGTLPLRQAAVEQGLPSAGPTKTTFVESKRGAAAAAAKAGGWMRSPGTAGTAGAPTPYSPYMPFTPVTPVTPRLVGRKERKARKKVEGRRVVEEGDLVKSSRDMWE
ncbi:hypothetical protein BDY21DRAFT_377157 [Lineolata rhizophorae]|uniref:Uncharacterized protein n=1 Tax=Lineolata rhizophorae TaxID=578093 RepID=A0A6A6P9K0_9PEZI|nr:hypothetical protein BDY21DRAFT_377157 [Lineolata rhizophorae]